MTEALKFDLSQATTMTDPTTGSGEISTFAEALGQNGRPFVFLVEDPPNKTRARHYHHGDVLYVYVKGEHHIEGEDTYRAGDLRWTRAGHTYGPETTGPDGGAWWVISYSDPIPVDVDVEQEQQQVGEVAAEAGQLPHFQRPYDWNQVDHTVRTLGGAILEGLLSREELDRFNADTDAYLQSNADAGSPQSGSDFYDVFLGHNTIRLHGLVEKIPSSADLIGRPEIVEWAERICGPVASSILLNAGELIQIQPGEPAQALHRDSDSWPEVPIGEHTVIANAIIALDDCTLENGATYIAPNSHTWAKGRQPTTDEFVRATMKAGDGVLFRADLIHGGGENKSDGRRRALSITYCAGWLRPVENSFLNIPLERVRTLSPKVQAILGYAANDASAKRGGLVGLYDSGDPSRVLEATPGE